MPWLTDRRLGGGREADLPRWARTPLKLRDEEVESSQFYVCISKLIVIKSLIWYCRWLIKHLTDQGYQDSSSNIQYLYWNRRIFPAGCSALWCTSCLWRSFDPSQVSWHTQSGRFCHRWLRSWRRTHHHHRLRPSRCSLERCTTKTYHWVRCICASMLGPNMLVGANLR